MHYHIRKSRFFLFPYTLFYGHEYPYCSVVGCYPTKRMAMAGARRDEKKRFQISEDKNAPIVWDSREDSDE